MEKSVTRTIRVCVATVMIVDTQSGTTRNEDFEFPYAPVNNIKILRKVSTDLHPNEVPVAIQGMRFYDRTYSIPIRLFMSIATVENEKEVHAV